MLITTALINNVVLSQFLGICPFIGVSKTQKTAAGMGGAVVFVITLSSAVAKPALYFFVLEKLDLTYPNTIVFIMVIAFLVQLVELFPKKAVPSFIKKSWCISSFDYNKLCCSWHSSYECTG